MEPMKVGLADYFYNIKRSFLGMFGWWDCQHCRKLHSPRVKMYFKPYYVVNYEVCSEYKREILDEMVDKEI